MDSLLEWMPKTAADWFTVVAVAFFVFLVVRLIAVGIASLRRNGQRVADPASVATATIIEEVRPTAVGVICLLLLIGATIGSSYSYYSATTVMQQIEAGIEFLGSTIFFGLGIIVGRKRVYRVYRAASRPAGAEAEKPAN